MRGAYSAKMSIPYSTAVALVYGKAGLQEFSDDVLKSPLVIALTKKITVSSDTALSDAFPQKQSAVVTIVTSDRTYSKRVDFPKGEPENPLEELEFHDRYVDLMSYGNIDKVFYETIYDKVKQPDMTVAELIKDL